MSRNIITRIAAKHFLALSPIDPSDPKVKEVIREYKKMLDETKRPNMYPVLKMFLKERYPKLYDEDFHISLWDFISTCALLEKSLGT